jgi:antitoxin ParD1/3/4
LHDRQHGTRRRPKRSATAVHLVRQRDDERISEEQMHIDLSPDLRALVQKAIESGRIAGEEEAVQEALVLWEERERRRLELVAMIDKADASLARGEGRDLTEQSMQTLGDDVKQRGRRRLAAERASSR